MRVLSVLCVISGLTLSACIAGSQSPAPVSLYGQDKGAGSAGVHVVSSGENLWTISNRYNVVMRDVVISNNLAAPFVLNAGQRIRLPAPREHRVRSGDSLYLVSKLYDVSSSEIARLNNLTPPYALRSGQVLKLPSVTPKTQPAVIQTASVARPVPDVAPIRPSAPIEREVLDAPVIRPSAPEAPARDGVDVNSVLSDMGSDGGAPVPGRKPGVNAPRVQKASATSRAAIPRNTPARSSSKFLKPVEGKVISSYGPKKNGMHNDGMNILAARGTPVKAAENAVVVYVGDEIKGSGNLVLLRHADRWMTAYGHLDTIKVQRGDTIKRGDIIGTVGSSGNVDRPQLHFEVRRGTDAINPSRYIDS